MFQLKTIDDLRCGLQAAAAGVVVVSAGVRNHGAPPGALADGQASVR